MVQHVNALIFFSLSKNAKMLAKPRWLVDLVGVLRLVALRFFNILFFANCHPLFNFGMAQVVATRSAEPNTVRFNGSKRIAFYTCLTS